MQRLLEIENQYESGQISLEEAHKLMREKVGTVRPYHLAYVEQTLKPETEDECIRVDMRKVIDLMDGFMDNSRPELPADHPIAHYYKENDEMRKLLLSVEDLVQYPLIKNQWLELYDKLREYPNTLSTQAESALFDPRAQGLRPPYHDDVAPRRLHPR